MLHTILVRQNKYSSSRCPPQSSNPGECGRRQIVLTPQYTKYTEKLEPSVQSDVVKHGSKLFRKDCTSMNVQADSLKSLQAEHETELAYYLLCRLATCVIRHQSIEINLELLQDLQVLVRRSLDIWEEDTTFVLAGTNTLYCPGFCQFMLGHKALNHLDATRARSRACIQQPAALLGRQSFMQAEPSSTC